MVYNPKDLLGNLFRANIKKSIIELLENKQLYQNIDINHKNIESFISKQKDERVRRILKSFPSNRGISAKESDELLKDNLNKYFSEISGYPWHVVAEPDENSHQSAEQIIKDNYIRVVLPTINIVCKKCKVHPMPHNPINIEHYQNQLTLLRTHPPQNDIHQLLILPYQCQKCKGEPLIFMIKRTNQKMQLVGRSQFSLVLISKSIPKEESKYYNEAIIAFRAGKTLAAIFYLRTMIEQYLRRILHVKDRISGEDLAEQYNKDLLPEEFPRDSFTSMKTIYEELSEKLHEAKEDSEQFEKSINDIERHFDQLRLLPLKELQTKPQNKNTQAKTQSSQKTKTKNSDS